MGFFSSDSDEAQAHSKVYGDEFHEHKASLTHEGIAAAAAYEATRSYEKHQAAKGEPIKHEKAVAALAALAAAAVDGLVETKGLDAYDREKLKYDAKKKAEAAYETY